MICVSENIDVWRTDECIRNDILCSSCFYYFVVRSMLVHHAFVTQEFSFASNPAIILLTDDTSKRVEFAVSWTRDERKNLVFFSFLVAVVFGSFELCAALCTCLMEWFQLNIIIIFCCCFSLIYIKILIFAMASLMILSPSQHSAELLELHPGFFLLQFFQPSLFSLMRVVRIPLLYHPPLSLHVFSRHEHTTVEQQPTYQWEVRRVKEREKELKK